MPKGIKGFQKGRAKTGGRKKGAPNKVTVLKTLTLKDKLLQEKEPRRLRRMPQERKREERERREKEAAAVPTSKTSTPSSVTSPGSAGHAAPRVYHPAGVGAETPLEAWRRKRRRTKNLSTGELVNMLEGLTPDGYNREGRKVSFIERDKPFYDPYRGRGRS